MRIPSFTSRRCPRRRGIAAIWAVVVLGVLTVIIGTITAQLLSNRQVLDTHANKLQCLWLARAGVELAAGKLLADPTGYKGETTAPIPHAQVRITVEPAKGQPNVFVVTSEARYPTDEPHPVTELLSRRFRRVAEKDRVRLESATYREGERK